MRGHHERAPCTRFPRIGVLSLLLWQISSSVWPGAFSPEKAGFGVRFRDQISPYRVLGVFVLPEEVLVLEAVQPSTTKKREYTLKAPGGETTQMGASRWEWRAPQERGLYPVIIVDPQTADSITMNIFVIVPYGRLKGEYLNGYRIGKYPTVPLKGLPIYRPPRGFIEVTRQNEETLVSPHFTLKQFLCKQPGGYPKYLVLRERLVLKLELVLEEVNAKGYRCDTFHIMSGYRTPYYNKAIGDVRYSRHVWGGAADIFIDESPKDDMMDDLNHDGKIDYRDAGILYDIIDEMYGQAWYAPFVGGLGRYRKRASHGPFVHVDVRGFRARWGQ